MAADSRIGGLGGSPEAGTGAGDLSARYRLFEAAVVHMDQGLLILDREQRVVFWNRRYEALWDFPPGLVRVGQPLAELIRFDVERSAARARVLGAVRDVAVAELENGHIPGSRFRNVHVSALLESLVTRRFALPAYVFVYRYDGRPYRAIVHGQRASIAFGDAPLAWGRIVMLVVLGLAVIGVVVAIVASR